MTGAEVLRNENDRLRSNGGGIYFVGLKSSIYDFLVKTGYVKHIGYKHFFDTKIQAIHDIYERLNLDICYSCKARVFNECPKNGPE